MADSQKVRHRIAKARINVLTFCAIGQHRNWVHMPGVGRSNTIGSRLSREGNCPRSIASQHDSSGAQVAVRSAGISMEPSVML
jgi:hypothetical protein